MGGPRHLGPVERPRTGDSDWLWAPLGTILHWCPWAAEGTPDHPSMASVGASAASGSRGTQLSTWLSFSGRGGGGLRLCRDEAGGAETPETVSHTLYCPTLCSPRLPPRAPQQLGCDNCLCIGTWQAAGLCDLGAWGPKARLPLVPPRPSPEPPPPCSANPGPPSHCRAALDSLRP